MSLSDNERQIFEQLEEQFKTEDPKLFEKLSRESANKGYSTRNIVIGVIIIVLGLAAIFAGVTTEIMALGIVGFVIMGAGAYLMTTKIKKEGTFAPTNPNLGGNPPKGKSAFMQKLEHDWEKRRESEGR